VRKRRFGHFLLLSGNWESHFPTKRVSRESVYEVISVDLGSSLMEFRAGRGSASRLSLTGVTARAHRGVRKTRLLKAHDVGQRHQLMTVGVAFANNRSPNGSNLPPKSCLPRQISIRSPSLWGLNSQFWTLPLGAMASAKRSFPDGMRPLLPQLLTIQVLGQDAESESCHSTRKSMTKNGPFNGNPGMRSRGKDWMTGVLFVDTTGHQLCPIFV
jgi:hypothetical protein